MPDPKIVVKDGKQYIEAPGMGLIPVDEIYANGGNTEPPSWLSRTGSFLKNASPEITGGLADALALPTMGLSLLAAPVVAGVTDAARQYGDTGHVDLGQAAFRGAENAIPGAVGHGLMKILKAGAPAAVDIGMQTMKGGVKGGLWAAAKSALGFGTEAAAEPVATNALARMTLGDGTRVLSSDGLKQLVQKSVELTNARGTPPAQIKALDALIQQVRDALQPTALSAADLLSKVGMKTSTVEAEAAAAAAATKAALAKKAGRGVNIGLRSAMGATQSAMATSEGM